MKHTLGSGAVSAVVKHGPKVMLEAVRSYWSVRRRGGLGASSTYLGWRAYTAYGAAGPLHAEDLVDFLRWRRAMRKGRM